MTTQNDEIDLFELFNIILQNKILIICITTLISLPTFLYLAFIFNPGYLATASVTQLDDAQVNKYQGLNQLIPEEFSVDKLNNITLSELFSGKSRSLIINSHDPRLIEFNGTAEEREDLFQNLLNNYIIERNDDADGPYLFTLTYNAVDQSSGRLIIIKTLEALNNSTLIKLNQKFQNIRNTKIRDLNYELRKIELEIQNLIDSYFAKLSERKTYLSEQASIARSLNIADNGIANLLEKGSITGISGQNQLPFYMRGYKAIEKELDILNNRDTSPERVKKYIPEYVKLHEKLLMVKNDIFIEHLDKEFKISPLSAENPNFINYQIDSITTKPAISKSLIMFIIFIASGIFSLLFVLIRHFLILNKSPKHI